MGLSIYYFTQYGWSDIGGHHDKQKKEKEGHSKTEPFKHTKEQLSAINSTYLTTVKPIFKQKCLDCHGSGNKMPWYFSIPGPRQLMNRDIQEAKEHLDMSNDFPFMGHGSSPKEDLEEIKKVIEEDSMPPWQYKMIHWNSSLTEGEKKSVLGWVVKSTKILLKDAQ